MFGALNTFFSGLAFIGLLATIGLQIYFHQKEMSLERDKIDLEALKEAKAVQKEIKDKLVYILAMFKRIYESNIVMADDLKMWLDQNPQEQLRISQFVYKTIDDTHELVSKRLNQESYYQCYKSQRDDNNILDAFGYVDDTLALRIQIRKEFERIITLNNEETSLITDLLEKIELLTQKEVGLFEIYKEHSLNTAIHIDQLMEKLINSRALLLKIHGQNSDTWKNPNYVDFFNTINKIEGISRSLLIQFKRSKANLNGALLSLNSKNNHLNGMIGQISIVISKLIS
ncbi:hypothetical protein GOQ04_17075 [Emticicia sp. ODNR4P]|nr:hypothetical protein [Emticicia sp. ODNR4P]